MIAKVSALVLAGMICMGAVFAFPDQRAFAHTFSGDESASFLALIESMKVELDLVQSNLALNATLAEEHAIHAHEHLDEIIEEISERNERLGRDLPAALENLHHSVANSTAQQIQTKIQNINDLLGDTVKARIDSEQRNNSTVWALVIANMADGVIGHYGAAYGLETEEGEEHGTHGHDDVESGNATNGDAAMTEISSENATHEETEEGSRGNSSAHGNGTIVSMLHYQSAQALAARTQALFNEQVKELAPANSTEAVTDLEAGLAYLKQAVDSMEPHENVEVIVHTEVHPNLQRTFNIQVIPEFPLPLLMIIPAIAGIIAASMIGALRRK